MDQQEKVTNALQTALQNYCSRTKHVDLSYLVSRTKANPVLLTEMIVLYLEQTDSLLPLMNESAGKGEWATLQAVMHKMIPSFSIVGISVEYENRAKHVQECAQAGKEIGKIPSLVKELDDICKLACAELREVLDLIKTTQR